MAVTISALVVPSGKRKGMERSSQRLRVYPRHDAELARVLPTLRDQRDDIVRERAEDLGRVRAENVDVAESMSG
jgi:hypothetical protein